jgi:hypothetical protein
MQTLARDKSVSRENADPGNSRGMRLMGMAVHIDQHYDRHDQP